MELKGRGVHAITKGEGAGEGRGEGSPGWNTSGWARGGPGRGMDKQQKERQEETRRLGHHPRQSREALQHGGDIILGGVLSQQAPLDSRPLMTPNH